MASKANDIQREIDALQRMATGELAERFEGLYGRPARTRHRAYLIRKVARRNWPTTPRCG